MPSVLFPDQVPRKPHETAAQGKPKAHSGQNFANFHVDCILYLQLQRRILVWDARFYHRIISADAEDQDAGYDCGVDRLREN